jgi:hypothetical protein
MEGLHAPIPYQKGNAMPYNVYLMGGLSIAPPINPVILAPQVILECQRNLQIYFDKIVRAHDAMGVHPFATAQVLWLAFTPVIEKHELLCYLLPEEVQIVEHKNIEKNPSATRLGHTRLYGSDPKFNAGSEVYARLGMRTSGLLMANLIMHELMHNKLNLDDDHLHPTGGMATGGQITTGTQLTPRNIQMMAAALHLPQKQWDEGINTIVTRSLDPNRQFP